MVISYIVIYRSCVCTCRKTKFSKTSASRRYHKILTDPVAALEATAESSVLPSAESQTFQVEAI